METAKNIARKALGLPPDSVLENITNMRTGELLLESVEYLPANCSVYIFHVARKTKKQILHS